MEHLWDKVKQYLDNRFGTGTYNNKGNLTLGSNGVLKVDYSGFTGYATDQSYNFKINSDGIFCSTGENNRLFEVSQFLQFVVTYSSYFSIIRPAGILFIVGWNSVKLTNNYTSMVNISYIKKGVSSVMTTTLNASASTTIEGDGLLLVMWAVKGV